MTAYKPYFVEKWGWLPSAVDDMALEDFRMCTEIVDAWLAQRRKSGR